MNVKLGSLWRHKSTGIIAKAGQQTFSFTPLTILSQTPDYRVGHVLEMKNEVLRKYFEPAPTWVERMYT